MLPATSAGSLTTTIVTVKPELGLSLRVSDRKSHPRNRIAGTATGGTKVSAHAGGVVNMATYPPSAQPGIIANQ